MRQPIHTVYGGAHLFRHDVGAKFGRIALNVLEQHRDLLPVPDEVAVRVQAKLRTRPVEDYRIDFEDGYGYRRDEEEDGHAAGAALEVALGMSAGTLPEFLGLRSKSFHAHGRARAVRTLRVFFRALFERTGGALPRNFTVTLPKVAAEEEVAALIRALEDLEAPASVELMVETPEALRNLRGMVAAAGSRIRGAHFGPYDFTSSCGVLGSAQDLGHPLCVHARNQMLVELAGTGMWLSDGPTRILPVGSREDVERAWKAQWEDIHRALSCGFYQGWDLHPAQLPLRYAAVFHFFEAHLEEAAMRMKNFVAQSAQATRVGAEFDDAATVRGLHTYFLRALGSGAMTEEELEVHCGLSRAGLEQLRF